MPIADIRQIATQFQLDGAFVSADRYGSGHINDTYRISATGDTRFILQRINQHVFRDPAALMENIRRVTDHLQAKSPEINRNLSLVKTQEDTDFLLDDEREYWRVYRFVEGAHSVDSPVNPGQARDAAAMFGHFQNALCDLPVPALHETISGFHDTAARYRQFHDAVENDSNGRVGECSAEIDRALAFENAACEVAALQAAGALPERIVHNDTKLNNVMFDDESGKAVCVVDLDTVMPGLALSDFGDLVRSATTSASEDENDPSKIRMRPNYFAALAEGYLSTAIDFLTEAEIDLLARAGKIITIETGVRFLTDHLCGDEYFRTSRPGHNLDRCRAQFALASSIDAQLDAMQGVVYRIASESKQDRQRQAQ
jgi:Ser/Thr protein kinase RdoA (MazF antagonist)